MKVAKSIRKAIREWESGDADSAMLHASNAIDGTAKKVYPGVRSSNLRFTRLLRENYSILGPFGARGFNLEKTRFPVKVDNPKAEGGRPDIADVIYGIHRCTHGHGEELPDGFALIPDAAGPANVTQMGIERGKVRLSDRIIFALLAIAVVSEVNSDQADPSLDGFTLSFGSHVLPINEWWGRRDECVQMAAENAGPQVTFDFNEWMSDS